MFSTVQSQLQLVLAQSATLNPNLGANYFSSEPNSNPNLQLTNIVEEEERQGSRSSQDKDTVEEEVEPSSEAGVSKLNSTKKVQPKIDRTEPEKPAKDHAEPGKTHLDHTEPIGETGAGALNEGEDKSDTNQPDEEPRNENETPREEEENSATTKRKVSRT